MENRIKKNDIMKNIGIKKNKILTTKKKRIINWMLAANIIICFFLLEGKN